MNERMNEIEKIQGEWECLFYDAFMITSDNPDKVTEEIRVRDIVKNFVNTLWNTKELLKEAFKDGYLPVECVGILNKVSLFGEEFYLCPGKVEACKRIAKRFVERIVYNEMNMFDDEIGIFTEEAEMPIYFYNIKEGDITSVWNSVE